MQRSTRWARFTLIGSWITIAWATAGAAAAASTPSDPMARGQQLTRWFTTGTLDSLHAGLDSRTAKILDARRLREFYDQVASVVVLPQRIVSETVTSEDTLQVYTRLATFGDRTEALEIQFKLDPQGVAHGFFVGQPRRPLPTKYLEYQTKTRLRLPFDGAWFVLWGGRTMSQNRHVVAPDQRFGIDVTFLQDGRMFATDGKAVTDYLAYGRPVLAPGAGVVVAVVDEFEDNAPGQVDITHPLGNHVVIDHGDGEFSWLAHLQKGSVAVTAGRKVKAGAVVGRCGASGAAATPQLHYHLQTTGEGRSGDGLPAFFSSYVADGKPVERGEPMQGQTVANPERTP